MSDADIDVATADSGNTLTGNVNCAGRGGRTDASSSWYDRDMFGSQTRGFESEDGLFQQLKARLLERTLD
jgi:hypothetical protein